MLGRSTVTIQKGAAPKIVDPDKKFKWVVGGAPGVYVKRDEPEHSHGAANGASTASGVPPGYVRARAATLGAHTANRVPKKEPAPTINRSTLGAIPKVASTPALSPNPTHVVTPSAPKPIQSPFLANQSAKTPAPAKEPARVTPTANSHDATKLIALRQESALKEAEEQKRREQEAITKKEKDVEAAEALAKKQQAEKDAAEAATVAAAEEKRKAEEQARVLAAQKFLQQLEAERQAKEQREKELAELNKPREPKYASPQAMIEATNGKVTVQELFDEFFDAAASNPDFDILDLFEQNSDDTIKSYFSNLQHFTEVVELMAAPKPPYDTPAGERQAQIASYVFYMWTSAANPALRELVANESEFAEAFFHPLECPVQYPDHSPAMDWHRTMQHLMMKCDEAVSVASFFSKRDSAPSASQSNTQISSPIVSRGVRFLRAFVKQMHNPHVFENAKKMLAPDESIVPWSEQFGMSKLSFAERLVERIQELNKPGNLEYQDSVGLLNLVELVSGVMKRSTTSAVARQLCQSPHIDSLITLAFPSSPKGSEITTAPNAASNHAAEIVFCVLLDGEKDDATPLNCLAAVSDTLKAYIVSSAERLGPIRLKILRILGAALNPAFPIDQQKQLLETGAIGAAFDVLSKFPNSNILHFLVVDTLQKMLLLKGIDDAVAECVRKSYLPNRIIRYFEDEAHTTEVGAHYLQVIQKLQDASVTNDKLKAVLFKNEGWAKVVARMEQERASLKQWMEFDPEVNLLKKMKAEGTAPSAKNLVVD